MIPGLLTSLSGEKISDKDTWESFRRKEIKALLEEYLYGKRPIEKPSDISFNIKKSEKNYLGEALDYAEIAVSFSGYSFDFYGFYPLTEVKVPAFVYIMHEYQERSCDFLSDLNCTYVPIKQIIARGYAVFIMKTSSIYPDWDNRADFKQGVFSVLSPDRENRKDSDWGSLSSWGWGASRIMDYIETDARIDPDNVAVIGHSRSGKAALICGAWDERFSLVISNASGCMGASLLRGKTGEHIKDLIGTDWFCEKFKAFSEKEDMFPVDQHMLLSMIAPRLLYVESCSEDDWADPKNERLSCALASEVYQTIYGKAGVIFPDEEIKVDTPYHEGNIGYHVKTGEHGITPYDWGMYMNFWEKHR